jgi:predicted ATP-dependent endonuclease of OLD family
MAEKPAKTASEWRSILLKDWPSRLVLTCLTAAMGYAWAEGKDVVERKILSTVQPALDTLKDKIETTDEKVEKVDAKLDAMIQVMIEAFPQFKKAAQERAEERRDSKEVQDALTGDAP